MKIGWIMGWAVPEAWFAAQVNAVFPEDEHVLVEPTATALAELAKRGPLDVIAGYSLGAHLLLAEAGRIRECGARVTLLAPFRAFAAEEGLGGRVARTQVRYLARWLKRDRAAALADFYARAGLEVTAEAADRIAAETLAWGLERLENGRAEAAGTEGWRMYAGNGDSLLETVALGRALPGLRVVAGATHHPGALLRAWREDGLT